MAPYNKKRLMIWTWRDIFGDTRDQIEHICKDKPLLYFPRFHYFLLTISKVSTSKDWMWHDIISPMIRRVGRGGGEGSQLPEMYRYRGINILLASTRNAITEIYLFIWNDDLKPLIFQANGNVCATLLLNYTKNILESFSEDKFCHYKSNLFFIFS